MKDMRYPDWVILFIGLLSTSLITIFVYEKNKHQDTLKIHYETNLLLRRIQSRIQSYEGSLIEFRAFLKNSPDLRRKTIKHFLDDTEIFQRFPGLQGIGYIEVVSKKNYREHVRLMKKVYPAYTIFPSGERELYSPVIMIEPDDSINGGTIGFDMSSDKKRRHAMIKAQKMNMPIMSEKITLTHDNKNTQSRGFDLYLPHFGPQKKLLGYVYSPFRAQELFETIFSDIDMVLDIQIYDGEYLPENLSYDYQEYSQDSDLGLLSELSISGRKLLIRTSPLARFHQSSSLLKIAFTGLLGITGTILIYTLFLFSRRQVQLARKIAWEKEHLLVKEKEHVVARDDFLSIASHELKTPLTSLKLQAQVMQRAMKRNDPGALSLEKVSRLVGQIDNQTTRLTRLVDDMLDISRIRTGRLKIQKEKVELSEMINEVIERLSPEFLRVIGTLPSKECEEGIWGYWDRFRIEQVMTNLFTNAIRYGNGKPISVKTRCEGKVARIQVRDQGMGIAPDHLEKIFDRFERAGMSSSEVSGLGLGLFISKQIIKAHEGSLWVESELDKGAEFIIELPLGS